MVEEKTVCFKISKCLDILEHAIKNNELDEKALGHYLHEIREDAQHMENALKLRKEMMHEAGIEQDYQKEKAKRGVRPGINNIPDGEVKLEKDKKFHAVIMDGDTIIYKNDIYGGVLSLVEEEGGVDNFGEIAGRTQSLYFGNPLIYFFAFEQLQKSLEERRVDFMLAFKKAMEGRTNLDPKVKKILDQLKSFSIDI